MQHSLGRAYPSGIENTISGLGKDLDDLMASSMDLLLLADYDARGQIGELNARLVNEVIIVSDQISDEEARNRLFQLQKDIFILQGIFKQQGVAIRGYAPEPTVEEVAPIPVSQAKVLHEEFLRAYDLYPSVVDRYVKVRPVFDRLAALAPMVKMALLAPMDARIRKLDEDVFFARDAAGMLETAIAESTDAVRISRGTFVRIQNWISGVDQMDETLKRLEGKAEGKPAEAAAPGRGSTLKNILYGTLAAGGALLVLRIFKLI